MRFMAFTFIITTVVLTACSLAASDSPAAVQIASADCLELDEALGVLPSPTPTAAAPTPFVPSVQPTAASRPGEDDSTPTPYPTPIPTPTVSVAPTQLPAAPAGDDMGDRFTLVGTWEPPYPDGFGSETGLDGLAIFEREDGRYAFAGTDDGLRLYRLVNGLPPQPQDTRIGPLPERMGIRALDVEESTLAVWLWMEEFGAVLFYDISDLRSPCLAGSYLDASGFFDLDGRTAYVENQVSERRRDLVIIPDVTNSAHTVAIEGMAYHRDADDSLVSLIRNYEMQVSDGIAYMNVFQRKGTKPEDIEHISGFASLDLRNPESPVWLDEIKWYGSYIYIIGDLAYVMRGDIGVRIIDISDPANMRVIGELTEDSPGYASSTDPMYPGGLIVDGSRLYALLWGGDWGVYHWRLRIADISDPANPRGLGRLEGDGIAHGMWLQGNEVVIADAFGFSFIDVSGLANPTETHMVPKATFSGAVHLRDSFAYLFLYSGIFTLDLANPGAPEQVSFHHPGPIGNVRESEDGFDVEVESANASISMDISDPTNPVITEYHDGLIRPPHPSKGPYIYHASCGSLHIERMDDRRRFAKVRLAESKCREEWRAAAHQGYLYVAGGGSLYILDASDPAMPVLLTRKALVSALEDVWQSAIQIDGGYAYVLHDGLRVLGLSDPTQPREVAYYPTDARVIDVDGDRIALAGPRGAFTLLHLELE